ncbi:MAG: hypothetical protein WCI45_11930, partial [Desulfuromonadales bacterium]
MQLCKNFQHKICNIGENIMLIVMNHNATQADVDSIGRIVQEMGFRAEPIPGSERTA